MAKTKEQKQAEALERLRKAIPAKRQTFLDSQERGPLFVCTEKYHGYKKALTDAEHTSEWFKRMCAEAKVDTSGNHLEDL